MPVNEVSNFLELDQILNRADANRLIIIDFYANWCGPCRAISPYIEQLSEQFPNATFLKVNVDVARDLVTRYAIRAMPTFFFFKDKDHIDTVRGANQQAILSTIQKHYSSMPANPNAATNEEKAFLEQFVRFTELNQRYTDEVHKALARSVMPEDLVEKALGEAPEEIGILKGASKPLASPYSPISFLELLLWYKTKFFTWFDSPNCTKCGVKCEGGGLHGTPTREEVQEGAATRVEIFHCDKCNTEMRFPRYNNPAKLLQTRTGRCGEWANCFGLLLTALNFDTRFILDITDHVWNEVYLKKKAGGSTWIPANQRTEVRPQVFLNFLTKLNARQMAGVTEERKKELELRRVCELMEMMAEEKKNHKIGWEKLGENMGGRISGSEEWRKARGEIGSETAAQPKPLGEAIKLSATSENCVEFSYDINRDVYSIPPEKGFISQTFECKNIQRKVETDWNFVYLCREDGKEGGEIAWHFDLEFLVSDSKKTIEKVEIQIDGIQKFEKANVMVIACLGDTCMRIPSKGNLTIDTPKPGVLKISASLFGGEGNCAFQQAQLFRTKIEDSTKSFVVKVYVK
uniref:Peptide-N(4)-(N-acetyl-beta-glucosaminyl)asparagine amidase n=1 Tax=Caenorhabditis tropicalis TaxID=1561998 RepID=A0A1I7UT52_9PELO